jgi:transcriptional regulator with PAS, ATPase and Fis domain
MLAIDGADPSLPLSRFTLAGLSEGEIGRGTERMATRQQGPSGWTLRIDVADTRASRQHCGLFRKGRRWYAFDRGSRNGTWVDGRRLRADERAELRDGTVLVTGRTGWVFRRAPPRQTPRAQENERDVGAVHPDLFTMSLPLKGRLDRLVKMVEGAGPSILVRGETGSGKELIARAVHGIHHSLGRRGDFVAVNCGALPETLVEAELFGAKKGAYSGAETDRPGLVPAANGGTLFLDEVGDLRAISQAALLRVLEQREVVAVGATHPIPVDIAVIAATHRDIDAMMDRGSFRADLYARLAGYELTLPPLRDRREDLGWLLRRFMCDAGAIPTISAEAVRALMSYDWPLNVRELKAAAAQAWSLAEGGTIEPRHLPVAVTSGPTLPKTSPPESDGALDDRLRRLLSEHRGNVSAVARATGKHRRQVQRWLSKLGIDPDDYRQG